MVDSITAAVNPAGSETEVILIIFDVLWPTLAAVVGEPLWDLELPSYFGPKDLSQGTI